MDLSEAKEKMAESMKEVVSNMQPPKLNRKERRDMKYKRGAYKPKKGETNVG